MTRFSPARDRQARIEREYQASLREINDMPDMAQLPQTRGPDPLAEDLAWLTRGFVAGLILAAIALVAHFRVWEWAETIMQGAR